MQDEIKEILDDKKVIIDQHWNFIIIGNEKYYELPKKLLNYITNLQEENERLKEENKRIFSKVNDDELLISNAMNYAEAQDYKSRIDKAIEILEQDKASASFNTAERIALNILGGDDND